MKTWLSPVLQAEEASTEKVRLEEELLRARDKISQLRDTRDTLRTSNDNMLAEIKSTTGKLEAEVRSFLSE